MKGNGSTSLLGLTSSGSHVISSSASFPAGLYPNTYNKNETFEFQKQSPSSTGCKSADAADAAGAEPGFGGGFIKPVGHLFGGG